MTIRNDYTGKTFGRLLVVKAGDADSHGNRFWMCKCECGSEVVVAGHNLRTRHTQSCGCMKKEVLLKRSVKHGYARAKRRSEYNSWKSAKGRCFNPGKHQYCDYGGRGTRMCRRWAGSFVSFLEDMGDKPTLAHTVDRIDNDGHYSCGKCDECLEHGWKMNCRWATRKQQANNRRPRRRCRK